MAITTCLMLRQEAMLLQHCWPVVWLPRHNLLVSCAMGPSNALRPRRQLAGLCAVSAPGLQYT